MAHQQQYDFISSVKSRFPSKFANSKVLEVGSLDINGSIRSLFTNCEYIGVDLGEGPGVDLVCAGENLTFPNNTFDTVASCECFEHNEKWAETFANMVRMTKPGGLILMSCATTGRPEHGTRRTTPQDAPFCSDYYKNLTKEDFNVFNLLNMFKLYEFSEQHVTHDLYFFGIKNG